MILLENIPALCHSRMRKRESLWSKAKDGKEPPKYLPRSGNTLGIDGEGGTDPENYDRALALNMEGTNA